MKNLMKGGFAVLMAALALTALTLTGCSSDGSTTTDVSVTGVTLDKSSLILNVGDSATLAATVAPANATNKAVTWSTSDETKATVANGVVTAVAAGPVTITVTTKDGSKTAACSVTVNAPGSTKTLTGITVTTPLTKIEYHIGETLNTAGMVVTATYSDGTTAAVAATDYTLSSFDSSTTGNKEITVTYEGKTAVFNVTVIDPPRPTVTPITVADISITAPAKGAAPAAATFNEEQERFTDGPVTWSPSDNPFKPSTVYTATVTLTAKEGYTFTGIVEANVKVNGAPAKLLTNTGETITLSRTFPATGIKTVTEIAIKTQPAKLTYTHGDKLVLDGLALTLTYDDGTFEDVAAGNFTAKNITADPAHGIPLEHTTYNGKPVTVKYGNFTKTTGNLTVNAKSVSDLSVDAIPEQIWTGSAITPEVTVKHAVEGSTRTLRPDTDYTLSYSNNTATGTATVTITGKGDYTGTKTATFTIVYVVGETEISLSFAAITDAAGGISLGTIALKRVSGTAADRTKTLTLTNAAQYDAGSISWLVNGITIGTGASVTLNAKDYRYNTFEKYYLTVSVKKDGVPYSKVIPFTVGY